MENIQRALDAACDDLTASVLSHPFLRDCREGVVPLARLKSFLVQQGHYSRHFTRYLCAMMSNLPEQEQILALAENLFEELGLSDDSQIPHSVLYRQMLERFDLSLEQGPAPLPETTELIRIMTAHCRDLNPARGLGALCLGAESLVGPVYASILEGFAAHGLHGPDLDFFTIHIECDDGHAGTLQDIMVRTAGQDPAQLEIMIASGTALVRARCNFFSAILAARCEHELATENA